MLYIFWRYRDLNVRWRWYSWQHCRSPKKSNYLFPNVLPLLLWCWSVYSTQIRLALKNHHGILNSKMPNLPEDLMEEKCLCEAHWWECFLQKTQRCDHILCKSLPKLFLPFWCSLQLESLPSLKATCKVVKSFLAYYNHGVQLKFSYNTISIIRHLKLGSTNWLNKAT